MMHPLLPNSCVNQRERLLATLDRQEVDRVSVASPVQTGTYELMKATGTGWPSAHQDPEKMAVLSMAAHTIAGLEGVRVPFQASVDQSAFLAAASRYENTLEKMPEDPGDFEIPQLEHGLAPVLLKAVSLLRQKVNDEVSVIAGAAAPFTLACQLMGEERAIMDLAIDPTTVSTAIKKAEEWCLIIAEELLKAGADVIVPLDPTSTGDILSPSDYGKYALPGEQNVASQVRRCGGHTIMHICGNTSTNLHLMRESRMDGINVDQVMNLVSVKEVFGPKIAVVGNVAPYPVLNRGTTEEVRIASLRCLRAGTDVLAPGCAFAPETPIENMRAMVNVARE
jgi:[methyl-Co(III) methanol-specific corrinoid protein]:coenzyme M methyltransferase